MLCGVFAVYDGKDYLGSDIGLYMAMPCLLLVLEVGFNGLAIYNNHAFLRSRLKYMTHEQAFRMIKNGKAYMFADDLVIDVKSFQFSHPGGSYMISEALGEDTGKYMTGCSSYGGNFQPYTHSERAFTFLRYLAIAKVSYPEGYVISKTPGIAQEDFMEFQIYSQQPINEHTWLLTLKSNFYNICETCEPK